MSKFEVALEQCLASMQSGDDLEVCLKRYPEFSVELRPLLQAAKKLEFAGDVVASPEFKTRTRARLGEHMRVHPRRAAWRRPALVLRYATSLAVLVLTFATTGFAFAQNALPGEFLYSWKLASEQVWRSVHVNTVYVDLELTYRRLQELLAVKDQPELAAEALRAYAASLRVLQEDVGRMPQKAAGARDVMKAQKQTVTDNLNSSIESVDELFQIIPTLEDLIKENPQQEQTEDPNLELPLLLTPIPTVVKKQDEGATDEDKSWLEEILSNVLGE